MPDNEIVHLFADHAGALWIVAGVSLCRFQDGKFSNFDLGLHAAIAPVRIVGEDRHRNLWIAGYAGVVKLSGGKLTPVVPAALLDGNAVNAILADRHDNIWVGGSRGLIELSASGTVRRFSEAEMPNMFVRALAEDRDGNIWLGGDSGLARLEEGRFVVPGGAAPGETDVVRSLLEDREGNLWAGANDGLTRFRDDLFTIFGKPEGLPSDEPTVTYQDHAGRIWVGFHDSGLMLFQGRRLITARDGLPATEVFSIRETHGGDLLVSTRLGLARESGGRFRIRAEPDPLGRTTVFDALEDSAGRLWLASTAGLTELRRPGTHRDSRRSPDRQRHGDAAGGERGSPMGRDLRKGSVARAGRREEAVHRGGRASQRSDPRALSGRRWRHLDRHVRRRPGHVPRRAASEVYGQGRPVERQRRQHRGRWRLVVAQHHAGPLPRFQAATV